MLKKVEPSLNLDTVYAILFSVLGAFFNALAMILMKQANNRFYEKISKKLYADPYWLGGFFCLIPGSAFYVISLGYGNVMLLAWTSSISIIINTILAVCYLGEKLHCNRVCGIFIICVGSTIFVSLAKNSSVNLKPKELFKLVTRPASIGYIILQFTLLAFFYIGQKQIKDKAFKFVGHCKQLTNT